MLIIAHRGNTNGPDTKNENTVDSILKSISMGFTVEIDVRVIDGKIYLGHDTPDHLVDLNFLTNNKDKLIIHCKNKDAIVLSVTNNLHYFWHQNDNYTITSNGNIWIHTGQEIPDTTNTIYALPENYSDEQSIKKCFGVCTDYPLYYDDIYNKNNPGNMYISYVIATYAGKNHPSNGDIAEIVLDKQIEFLCKLLENKRINKVKNNIMEVVIVCPEIKDKNNLYENFYQFDKWSKMLKEYNVDIVRLSYVGDNKHHSYDQWIQGYLNSNKNTEYILVVEDDYYLDYRNVNLDIDLVKYYKKSFKNNIGYLSTLNFNDPPHGLHAAISNGLISRQTMNSIPDILHTFYSERSSWLPQVNFSKLFLSYNIPIKDFSDTYNILFWNSYIKKTEDYTKAKNALYHVFVPVQYMNL